MSKIPTIPFNENPVGVFQESAPASAFISQNDQIGNSITGAADDEMQLYEKWQREPLRPTLPGQIIDKYCYSVDVKYIQQIIRIFL